MNKKEIFFVIILSLLMFSAYSQEKSKKELKQQQKLEKQKQIDSLVNTKEFVFIGRTAYPQGTRSINLTTRDNFVKFFPDTIISDLPYFGRSYSGGYGDDGGIKFNGKAEEYTFTKTKKEFQVKATIKSSSDTYRLFLTVSFDGGAYLSVNCNKRSSISYNGDISIPLEK